MWLKSYLSLQKVQILEIVDNSQICPGLNANEIQIPRGEHHKVSSLVKSHQNTHNSVNYEVHCNTKMSNSPAKYEVLNQYFHLMVDVSG